MPTPPPFVTIAQTVALEPARAPERLYGGEEFLEIINSQHTGSAKRRVVNLIGPCQGSCVAVDSTTRLFMPSSFNSKNRFVTSRRAGSGHEVAVILD